MNRTLSRCLLAASIAGLAAASAAQASTTLRMSHFWPDGSGINQEIFQAWAETIEEQSGGELRVENFPSQTLTRADQAYQGAVNGISDIHHRPGLHRRALPALPDRRAAGSCRYRQPGRLHPAEPL